MNRLKKVVSCLITLLFTLTVAMGIPVKAGAQSGGGVSEGAIIITSGAQLEQIPNGSTGHYILANDIDMGQFPAFNPIRRFAGHFDGAGHVIKNLKIPGATDPNAGSYSSIGFFEVICDGAVIENLGIYECYIEGQTEAAVGALAGRVESFEGKIKISNCYSSGYVAGTTAGGLIGVLSGDVVENGVNRMNVVVENCYSTARVKGSSTSGGLIASVMGGTLRNCYSKNKNTLPIFGCVQPAPEADNCYGMDSTSDDVFFNADFYKKLNAGGSAFKQDIGSSYEELLNSGLPVLSWQKPVCGIDVFLEWYVQGTPADIVNVTMKDKINQYGCITYSVSGPVSIPETIENVSNTQSFLRFGNDATNGLGKDGTYTLTVKDTKGISQSYNIIIKGAAGGGEVKDSPTPATAPIQDVITVTFNGKPITFDQPPVMMNDRVLVPMRAIFETLGATVSWNGDTQTVTAVRGSDTIVMTIGVNDISVNGANIHLDVPPVIVNDRTMVPVRAVAEGLKAKVEWIGESNTVSITTAVSADVGGGMGSNGALNAALLDTIKKSVDEVSSTYGDVTVLSEFTQDNTLYKNIKFANLPYSFMSARLDGKDVICSFDCPFSVIFGIDPASVSSIDALISKIPLKLISRSDNDLVFEYKNGIYIQLLTGEGVKRDTTVTAFITLGV